MTVREFAKNNNYQIATGEMATLDQPMMGVYACDLLSWAMAKVSVGDVWTTVHTNLNVVAVASLTGAACVIIPEGVEIEEQTLARANREDVPMISAPHSAAEICVRVYRAIAGDVLPG